LLEDIDKNKIYASRNWKGIEQKQSKLAKDFKMYLDKDKFKEFIELANQVIEANNAGKTNANFPKLEKETWQDILKIISYLRNEDPRLKPGAKMANDVWAHERYVREELEALEVAITKICEGFEDSQAIAEGKNHLGETTYSSFSAWKTACKKIAPNVWYDGDKEIANAMVGPNPYVRGKTKGIGDWDGETGTVYKDAAETVASVVTEAKSVEQQDAAILKKIASLAEKIKKLEDDDLYKYERAMDKAVEDQRSAPYASAKAQAAHARYYKAYENRNKVYGRIGQAQNEMIELKKKLGGSEVSEVQVNEAKLPEHAKLLNGEEVELHELQVYFSKKGDKLYIVNGKVLNEFKATNKNLSVDDVEVL
jgi:hypothetical protein